MRCGVHSFRVVPVLLAAACAAAALFAAPRAAIAQDTAPAPIEIPRAPILTLDQDRLFSDSIFGKAVIARHQADVDALLAENRRIEAALEAEELDLTERRATLPPADFQSLATAFDAKAEDIRNAQNAKDRAIAQRLEAERQRFYQAAAPVLADILREAGAMAIIDKRAIVLSFDAIDMTPSAVARLDAVLGDGSTPAPAEDTAPAASDPAKP